MGRKSLWIGRALSGLGVLFLTFDTIVKLLELPIAVQGTVQLGYSPAIIFPLGIIEAISLALYLIPRTSLVGVVLWTGYLGGAVATHVRMGDSLFGPTVFPCYVAALLWGGLVLRDRRLRALVFAPTDAAASDNFHPLQKWMSSI